VDGLARVLVCYYSFTGNTRLVARELQECLHGRYSVDIFEVVPERARRYVVWLVYSFFPGSRVGIKDIQSDISVYDLVCLGTPKWTFSCPPLNEYIHKIIGYRGKRILLFVTYGGFREKAFVSRIVEALKKKGASQVSVLLIKRSRIVDGSYRRIVNSFCASL